MFKHSFARLPYSHLLDISSDQSSNQERFSELRKLAKSSGIYAVFSAAAPLISLVLAPFLTRHFSLTDYGILTLLNIFISLAAGISQLGLGSAFFRAYGYDYTSASDRRDVLATCTMLLFLISVPLAIGVILLAPFFATLLFGSKEVSSLIVIAGCVILLQNLTVPGFAWLRSESRALFYSLLSIGNLLITVIATVVLIVVLHLGIASSLIASGLGYAWVLICILPITLRYAGIKLRVDIARSMLAFGVPLVLNYVSYWVLQVSDRYLLSLLSSLSETAKYGVAYTMGTAMTILIISPFTLAWPTAMFAIAKRVDSTEVYRRVFRWFSLFLLFAAFLLSLLGTVLLDRLFPVAYRSAASVIPIVSVSIALYGVYILCMIGSNIKRKTWLGGIFMVFAAIINLILNFILIPHYGLMGAAVSTLIAYIALTAVAYVVNQRIYPIPFEIGIFIFALLLGVALYVGSYVLNHTLGTNFAWGISILALCFYGVCLVILVRLPFNRRKNSLFDRMENPI